jgi:quercetin dioxygenase-like cupin family protein
METSKFLGMENRVLLTASETEGAAGVIDISIQPGAGAPLHTNTREALMWYVVDGLLTLQTEQGPVEVAAGSASFLPIGSTHRFLNRSETPARALLVCIPGGFEGFLLDLSGKLPADVPSGPPPPQATKVMVGTAEPYGVKLHPDDSAS